MFEGNGDGWSGTLGLRRAAFSVPKMGEDVCRQMSRRPKTFSVHGLRARSPPGRRILSKGGWAVSHTTESFMAFTLECCAELLSKERVRHHVDAEQAVIRMVFVTRHYKNLRGEKLAIAQITTPDDGRRCRVTLERAFAIGADAAATCLSLCRVAADTPLVGVEFDADCENLRLVIETAVEDGRLTRLQLLAMVDSLVEAAEVWHSALGGRSQQAGEPEAVGTQALVAVKPRLGGRRSAA